MPMNWWTIAHRVGHAIKNMAGFQQYRANLRRELSQILSQVYNYQKQDDYRTSYDYYGRQQNRSRFQITNEDMMLSLIYAIGTMRSARERLLRNTFEFEYELIAQYIIEGKVHFNGLPSVLQLPAGAYGSARQRRADPDEDLEGWQSYMEEHLPDEMNHHIGHALDQCLGRIFVM